MPKKGYRRKYHWLGLIVFIGFVGLFTDISGAAQKIEIKKDILKVDDKGVPLVQCWSRPKSSGNNPNFFMGLKQITGGIIDLTGIKGFPFNNSVAFLVGVSKYKYLSPQLPFVENDLEELAKSLIANNGFDTVYIAKNEAVTPTLIKDYMGNKFRKELNPNDRLLFYYSGHGADIGGDTGYMQFSTFKTISDYDINNDVLNITECEQWSKLIKIKHMLFIFDCCVSGLGFTPKGSEPDRPPTCLSLSGNGSRAVITAGTGKENVYGSNDYSVFTKALLTTLNDDRLYQVNNGFLTVGEIFDQIKRKVSQAKVKQTPNMWDLEEDTYQGNFIFIDTKLQNVKLSTDDLETLHIEKTGSIVAEYGIIRLTSYVSGKVFIDDKEAGDIKSGEAREYIDQTVGDHIIKVMNGDVIISKKIAVVKGETSSLSINSQSQNIPTPKIIPSPTPTKKPIPTIITNPTPTEKRSLIIISYSVSGRVVKSDSTYLGISNVTIKFSNGTSTKTDKNGNWSMSGLTGTIKITAVRSGYKFSGPITVTAGTSPIEFIGELEDVPLP